MNQLTESTLDSFNNLGISPKVLSILDRLEFTTPTPIQRASIPVGLDGKDVIGIAQTGTGKTLAFGIPMIQSLAGSAGRGLVIVPTRELALQAEEMLQKVGRPMGISTVVLIGGAPIGRQRMQLRSEPRVIIATPGRLIDHLQSGSVTLDTVKVLVLDEADRMLDMGFAPQIARILRAVPRERQTMLFSATMPLEIVDLAKSYMQLPVRVEMAVSGTPAEEITHELIVVRKEDKPALLEKLLFDYTGTILVFSRTKHGARKILRDIMSMGHSAAELHSNRSLNQRREALDGFKSGQYRVLVATDIAARGIDVTGIELVLNYDMPDQAEDYVHRVGRTGRAGKTGHAISFATPDQAIEVRSIEKLIRSSLPISDESQHALEAPLPKGRRASPASRPNSFRGPRRESSTGRSGASAPQSGSSRTPGQGTASGPRTDNRSRNGNGPPSEAGQRSGRDSRYGADPAAGRPRTGTGQSPAAGPRRPGGSDYSPAANRDTGEAYPRPANRDAGEAYPRPANRGRTGPGRPMREPREDDRNFSRGPWAS